MSYGSLGTVWQEIALDYSKFDQGISDVAKKTSWLDAETQKSLKNIEKQWEQMGKQMTKISAPLALIGGQMTLTFSKFEQSMANTASVAGATNDELNMMTKAARDAGASTVFSASQAADALYYMASAGFDANQSVDALNGVLNLAAATQSDLAYTSESVAATISQFGLNAEDATRVANVFASAISGSQATMNKLSDSMRYAGPVAAGFGMSLEETTAALEGLYNAGLRGEQAGTTMRRALQELAAPTGKSNDVLKELGLTVEDVSPSLHSFTDILDTLNKAGIDTTQTMVLFGEAGSGMGALLRQGGDAIKDMEEQITGTSKASEMAETQTNTLQGSIKMLKSAYEELSISLDEKFAPVMRQLIEFITDTVKWFGALDPAVQKFIVTTGALIAMLGPAVLLFKQLLNLAPFLFGPGGAILLGVSAVAGLAVAMSASNEASSEYYSKALSNADATKKQSDELDDLISEFERLSGKPNLAADEQTKLKTVMDRIIEIQPSIAAGYRDIKEAIESNLEPLKQYSDLLKQQGDLQIENAATKFKLDKPQIEADLKGVNEDISNLRSQMNGDYEATIKRQEVLLTALKMYGEAVQKRKEGLSYADDFNALSKFLAEEAGVGKVLESSIPNFAEKIATEKLYTLQQTVNKEIDAYGDLFKRMETLLDSRSALETQLSEGDKVLIEWENRKNPSPDVSEAFKKEVDKRVKRIESLKEEVKNGKAQLVDLQKEMESYYNWLETQSQSKSLNSSETEYVSKEILRIQPELESTRRQTSSNAVDSTTKKEIKNEMDAWQAKISLVQTGKDEYIKQYGDFANVIAGYNQWINEQLKKNPEPDAAKSLADALKKNQDALKSYRKEELDNEIESWETKISLVSTLIPKYVEKYGDLKTVYQKFNAWAKEQLNTNVNLDDSMKQTLAKLVIDTQDKIDQITRALSPKERQKKIDDLIASYGPVSEQMQAVVDLNIEIKPEVTQDPNFDFDSFYKKLQERLNNKYSNMIVTGEVSLEDQLTIVQSQIAMLESAKLTWTDEYKALLEEQIALEKSIFDKGVYWGQQQLEFDKKLYEDKRLERENEKQRVLSWNQFLVDSNQMKNSQLIKMELDAMQEQLATSVTAGENVDQLWDQIQIKKFEYLKQLINEKAELLDQYAEKEVSHYAELKNTAEEYMQWLQGMVDSNAMGYQYEATFKKMLTDANQKLINANETYMDGLENQLAIIRDIKSSFEELYGDNVNSIEAYNSLIKQEINLEKQLSSIRTQNELLSSEYNRKNLQSVQERQKELLLKLQEEANKTDFDANRWQELANALSVANEEAAKLVSLKEQFFSQLNPDIQKTFKQWEDWIEMIRIAPQAFETLGTQIKTVFGNNVAGQIAAAIGGGAAGSAGGIIGSISGAVAAAGIAGPEVTAVLAVVSTVTSLIGQAQKSMKDAYEALQKTFKTLKNDFDITWQDLGLEKPPNSLWDQLAGMFGMETPEMREWRENAERISNEMLQSLQTSMSTLGSAMASAISDNATWDDFQNVLRQQLQRIILEEVIMGEDFKKQAQKIVTMMQKYAEEGYTEEELKEIKERWKEIFDDLSNQYKDFADIFDLVFPETNIEVEHEIKGVQISRMASEDRDMFRELFLPLTVLYELPGLLTNKAIELSQTFQQAQIASIQCQEIIIEQVVLYAGDINVIATEGMTGEEILNEISSTAFKRSIGE